MFKQFKIQGRRMFGNQVDGVVEAMHYKNGELAWVRAYERRGPTWSDHVLLNRETLIARLQNGKKFFVGARIALEASEFDTSHRILVEDDILFTDDIAKPAKDTLNNLPIL